MTAAEDNTVALQVRVTAEEPDVRTVRVNVVEEEPKVITVHVPVTPDQAEGRSAGAKDTPVRTPRSRRRPLCYGGIEGGHVAINVLMMIPRSDPNRDRAFEMVTDWIQSNR